MIMRTVIIVGIVLSSLSLARLLRAGKLWLHRPRTRCSRSVAPLTGHMSRLRTCDISAVRRKLAVIPQLTITTAISGVYV